MNADERRQIELFHDMLDHQERHVPLSDEVLLSEDLAELAEMLEFVQQLKAAADPPPGMHEAVARGRERILASVPSMPPQAVATTAPDPAPATITLGGASWWQRLQEALTLPATPRWATASAVALAVVAVMMVTTFQVSASSIPGDPLYPIKLLSQELSILTTFDPQAKAVQQDVIRQKRNGDIAAADAQGRTVEVRMVDEVQGRQGNYWLIGSFLVEVTSGSEGLEAGQWVSLDGTTSGSGQGLLVDAKINSVNQPPAIPTVTPTYTPTTEVMQPGASLQSAATDTPAPVATLKAVKPKVKKATPVRRPRRPVQRQPKRSVATKAPTQNTPSEVIATATPVDSPTMTPVPDSPTPENTPVLESPTPTDEPDIIRITGKITEITTKYIVVLGNQFYVTKNTRVVGRLALGKRVTVRGRLNEDGSKLLALRIDVLKADGGETPDETATPTPGAGTDPGSPTATVESDPDAPSPTPTDPEAPTQPPPTSEVGPTPGDATATPVADDGDDNGTPPPPTPTSDTSGGNDDPATATPPPPTATPDDPVDTPVPPTPTPVPPPPTPVPPTPTPVPPTPEPDPPTATPKVRNTNAPPKDTATPVPPTATPQPPPEES